MSSTDRYPVPAGRHRVEETTERSLFVCSIERASTAEEAQAFIREMNTEFADATHNCWAYVAGPPAISDRIGLSDDGEPHGTAGRPMLTVLLHSGIGEIVAVVTRYYGGIKLGTGGLVKAYGGAVQLALDTLARVERVDCVTVALTIGYPAIAAVQQLLPSVEAELLSQAYDVDVRFTLRMPRQNVEALRSAVADATRGEGRLVAC